MVSIAICIVIGTAYEIIKAHCIINDVLLFLSNLANLAY